VVFYGRKTKSAKTTGEKGGHDIAGWKPKNHMRRPRCF